MVNRTRQTDEDKLAEFIEEIHNDPSNISLLVASYESSRLTSEEKREFEKEFFGKPDVLRSYFEENMLDYMPVEELIKTIYEKYIRAQGKLQDARDTAASHKEHIKDLKNEINELKKQIRFFKKSQEGARSAFVESLGKIPPQHIDMEEQILSTYFEYPSFMNHFSQPQLNKLFYKPTHKLIHGAMIHVQNKLTVTNVVNYLRKVEQLDQAGGRYFINQIRESESTDNLSILTDYIYQLEQDSLARELIAFANTMQREAFEGETSDGVSWRYEKNTLKRRRGEVVSVKTNKKVKIDDYVEHIRNLSFRLLELLPYKHRTQFNLSDNVKKVLKEIVDLKIREGKPVISTGYVELDRVTHGINANQLYIFGARPKNGKTTLSVNIADNVMLQDRSVGFFSYELIYKEILRKFIAKRARVDLEKFVYFDKEDPGSILTDEELKRIELASEDVSKLPLYLKDSRPSSLNNLVSECRQMKIMDPNLSLIIFDGLQAFESLLPERGNLSQYFQHVLTVLKNDIAKELDISVYINAQLKIDVENKFNKKPWGIENFSDCKSIPEITDGAFLLWRPEHYFDKPEYKNWLNVHPVELRNSGKKNKQFKLGIDIKYADIYNYKI